MVDILHKVGIKSSSLDDAYKALTTREGLSGWWTNNTQGEGTVGGVLQFRFGAGGIDMKVLELQPCYGKWSTDPQNGSAQRLGAFFLKSISDRAVGRRCTRGILRDDKGLLANKKAMVLHHDDRTSPIRYSCNACDVRAHS
jgi:hypothetical protein